MATTWIVAADSSRARVLQVADRERKLVEVDAMMNPQARLQDRDLQTDASTSGPASDREAQGAVEHSVRTFAKEPGRYLEHARTQHRYDELVLVAPPKFLGALREELGKEVERLVTEELPKDLFLVQRTRPRTLSQRTGRFALAYCRGGVMNRLLVSFACASVAYVSAANAQDPLLGRYTGNFTVTKGVKPIQIGMELVLTTEEQGAVKGSAKLYGGQCAGSYAMEGKFENNKLDMRGSGGPCPFAFSATRQGNKLVGATGAGAPLELSK